MLLKKIKLIWSVMMGRYNDVSPQHPLQPLIVERALQPLKLRSEFTASRYDCQHVTPEGIKARLIKDLISSEQFLNTFDLNTEETAEGFRFSTQLIIYNADK